MDVMENRRRILMAQEQFIPPEYQRADYLEKPSYASKTAAITDTGVLNDDATQIEFTYMAVEKSSYGRIMGSWDAEGHTCWRFIHYNSANGYYDMGYIFTANTKRAASSTGIIAVPAGGTIVGTKVKVTLKSGECTCSSDGYASTVKEAADGYAHSLGTVAIGNRCVEATSTVPKGRFYDHFKIWSGEKLVRDYIPAVRKLDNKAGFYDLVNHTFNPSIGNAEWIAGNDE